MNPITRVLRGVIAFAVDYGQRHTHPVNAVLHVVGVPMTFVGLYQAIAGTLALGLGLIALGFGLQYVGHWVHGNEMGEVMLAKRVWQRLRAPARPA